MNNIGQNPYWDNLTNQEIKRALEDVLGYESDLEKYITAPDQVDGDWVSYNYPGFGSPREPFNPEGLSYDELRALRPAPINQEKFRMKHYVFYDTTNEDMLKDALGEEGAAAATAAAIRNLATNIIRYRDNDFERQLTRFDPAHLLPNTFEGKSKEEQATLTDICNFESKQCIFRECQVVWVDDKTLEDSGKFAAKFSAAVYQCKGDKKAQLPEASDVKKDTPTGGTLQIKKYAQADTCNTIIRRSSFCSLSDIVVFADRYIETLIEMFLNNKLVGYQNLLSKLMAIEGKDLGLCDKDGELQDGHVVAVFMSYKAIKTNYAIKKLVAEPQNISTLNINRANHIKMHCNLSLHHPLVVMAYRKETPTT